MRIPQVWKEIQSIFIVLSLLGTQMWRLGEPKASMPKPMGMRRQLGKGTVICSNSIVLTCFKDLPSHSHDFKKWIGDFEVVANLICHCIKLDPSFQTLSIPHPSFGFIWGFP